MKKYILVVTTVLMAAIGYGQPKHEIFAFIDPSSDSSSLKFIQTYKSTSKKGEDIVKLFSEIKKQAVGKGANCFRLKNFTRDSLGEMTLVLDTYYGDNNFIEANFNNYEKNTVYLISDGNFNSKTYSFKVNKENMTIKSGQYYKCKIPKGDKVKINKGGFFGTTVTIVWEENKPCKFFSLSGFGLAKTAFGINPFPTYYGSRPGVGVAFTTGKLKAVDRDFGLLLTLILKEKQ